MVRRRTVSGGGLTDVRRPGGGKLERTRATWASAGVAASAFGPRLAEGAVGGGADTTTLATAAGAETGAATLGADADAVADIGAARDTAAGGGAPARIAAEDGDPTEGAAATGGEGAGAAAAATGAEAAGAAPRI